MAQWTRFDRAALPVTPWKNGGGATIEVACWPPGAGIDDFGWRISIAHISRSGAFSVFDGVDRSILLLDGDGVVLSLADGDHALKTPLEPFRFPGEAAVACALPGGASHDFNVMTRRDRWTAEVTVVSQAQALHDSPHGFVMAAAGAWQVARAGCSVTTFHAGQGAWWVGGALTALAMPVSADARLLQVALVSLEAGS